MRTRFKYFTIMTVVFLQHTAGLRHLYHQHCGNDDRVSRQVLADILFSLGFCDTYDDSFDSKIDDWMLKRKMELKWSERRRSW